MLRTSRCSQPNQPPPPQGELHQTGASEALEQQTLTIAKRCSPAAEICAGDGITGETSKTVLFSQLVKKGEQFSVPDGIIATQKLPINICTQLRHREIIRDDLLVVLLRVACLVHPIRNRIPIIRTCESLFANGRSRNVLISANITRNSAPLPHTPCRVAIPRYGRFFDRRGSVPQRFARVRHYILL